MSLLDRNSYRLMDSNVAKASILVAIVLLVVFLALRIWMVNAQAVSYPERHCEIGGTVDLSGTFYETFEGEGDANHGYSVRVDKAEVLSPNEFIAKYAANDKTAVEDGDERSIVNLTCTFTNKDNEDGGLSVNSFVLVPSSMNSAWTYDAELWERVYPFMAEQSSFSLKRDTTFTMQIPFYLEKRANYFSDYDETGRVLVTDAHYQLLLCNAPERIWVDVDL